MHIKKRYESANAGRLAVRHAMSVANKVADAVEAVTGTRPSISLDGSRIASYDGAADAELRVKIGNVGDFDPGIIDPEDIDATLVSIGRNENGVFPIVIDVTAISAKESADITVDRKIQAGLHQMEELFAAIGHNVSYEYNPEKDVVVILIDNSRAVKTVIADANSALDAINSVWKVTNRYL